jgi:tetratricopeptide (TPR) repeat protein
LAAAAILVQPFTLPAGAEEKGDPQWTDLQARGVEAARVSEYGDAERLLTRAVHRAETFPPGDERLAKSAGELGRLLTVRGRFPEAQKYLEEELHVKMQDTTLPDSALIQPMAAMVRFYLNYGTIGKADPLAEKILSFVNGKLSEASNQAQGKVAFKEGVPLQAWAGEAAKVARDPLIEWAIACDDIGTQYSTREDATAENLAMAERLFKTALDVKSTVLGKEHLSLANSYDSLGSLNMLRNQYEDAESYYKDALEITEKILPPQDAKVYSRLDKLGKCLIKENKMADAEALYQRAQTLWKDEPSNNGNEFRAMYALGSLYAQEKKYAEAVPVLEQALQGAEVYLGPDSVGLVPYLQRYAYVLYYVGRRSETDSLRARAKTIQPVIEALTMKAKKLDP